jgi:S1-C subfamily serine protease
MHRAPPRAQWVSLILFLVFGMLLGWWFYRTWGDRGSSAVAPRTVAARGDLAQDEKSTISLFRTASPSVVFITTLQERINLAEMRRVQVPAGTGSGFIWDNAGHIVTNFHVVSGARAAKVTLSDHTTLDAELTGVAPTQDIAVLRIHAPASKMIPISIGSSKDLQVGQKVFAIGDPFGLDQTLTSGIVSALGRTIEAGPNGQTLDHVIQTDAAINPGNSGGPLLDSAGRLIGMNTAIYSPSGSNAGIGFAIPVDVINRIVPQIIAKGSVARPSLSIEFDDRIGQPLTRHFGLDGVLVIAVKPNSPAERAGLRGTMHGPEGYILGDIIQAIDGTPVHTEDDIYRILERHNAGDVVTLTIFRATGEVQVKVQLVKEQE